MPAACGLPGREKGYHSHFHLHAGKNKDFSPSFKKKNRNYWRVMKMSGDAVL